MKRARVVDGLSANSIGQSPKRRKYKSDAPATNDAADAAPSSSPASPRRARDTASLHRLSAWPRAILCDIDGTTTSSAFVKKILFPFFIKHVGSHLDEVLNQTDRISNAAADGQHLDADMRTSTELAYRQLFESYCRTHGGSRLTSRDAVKQFVCDLTETGSRVASLKLLQGNVWKQGYRSKRLHGHFYKDAVVNLMRWHDRANCKVAFFSSGSVDAQKMLVAHATSCCSGVSTEGAARDDDVRHWNDEVDGGGFVSRVSHYFDLDSVAHASPCGGGKHVASSYAYIAHEMGVRPGEIMFLTDSMEELVAARSAGLEGVLIMRAAGRHSGYECQFDGTLPVNPWREANIAITCVASNAPGNECEYVRAATNFDEVSNFHLPPEPEPRIASAPS